MRKAAEVHKKVRKSIQPKIRPGMRLIDLAELVESTAKREIGWKKSDPLRRRKFLGVKNTRIETVLSEVG